jgi:DNA-directed RNA polymerase sigma subunit (sigma70/sigma32)
MEYAESRKSLDQDVEYREEMGIVRDLMDRALTERYKTILNLRLEGATLEETGRIVGLSKERIRQIEARAIDHIRKIHRGLIPCRVIYTGERHCRQPMVTPESVPTAKSTADCL